MRRLKTKTHMRLTVTQTGGYTLWQKPVSRDCSIILVYQY